MTQAARLDHRERMRPPAAFVLALVVITTTVFAAGPMTTSAIAAGGPVGTFVRPRPQIDAPHTIVRGPDGTMWFSQVNTNDAGPGGAATELTSVDGAGTVTPIAEVEIDHLAAGPAGQVVTASQSSHLVQRVGAGGDVTTLLSSYWIRGIAVGPDGTVWATRYDRFQEPDDPWHVARIDPGGTVTWLAGVGPGLPESIAVAADGRAWFTTARRGFSWRDFPSWDVGEWGFGVVSPDGVVSQVATPPGVEPRGLVRGAGDDLWFVVDGPAVGDDHRTIGRIDASGTVTTFPVPLPGTPGSITAGPDGAMWFTSSDGTTGGIGRITADGTVTTFTDGVGRPGSITTGHDGALWFVDHTSRSIRRMSTTGTVTTVAEAGHLGTPMAIVDAAMGSDGRLWTTAGPYYYSPDAIQVLNADGTVAARYQDPALLGPRGIAAGSDGNLWVAGEDSDTIARITPAGLISTFTHPDVDAPRDVADGPGGNLTFTSPGTASLGTITPDGTITVLPVGVAPDRVVVDGDGNRWFTVLQGATGSIGRMAPGGEVSLTATGAFVITDLTIGPDGAVWFTDSLGDRVGHIAPGAPVTWVPTADITGPSRITTGPDGNLWIASRGSNRVGRLTTSGTVSAFLVDWTATYELALVPGNDGDVWLAGTPFPWPWRGWIGQLTVVGDEPDPPLAPADVQAVAGDGELTVEWRSVEPSGPVPVTYTATASPGGATCTTTTRSCTITGLTNGTGHTVTVAATSWAGTGPGASSPLVHPRTPPTGLEVEAGNGSLAVTWQAPVPDGGPAITGYTARASDGRTCTWAAGPLGCTITGLQNGAQYAVVVTPMTEAGPGAPSEPSGPHTPRTVPGPPGWVAASPELSSGIIIVGWSSSPSNGAAITSYTATADPGGRSCTWTGGPLECFIDGLANGVPVTVTVTATNAAGTGPASAPSAPVRPTECSTAPGPDPFPDVTADHPFCDEIEWLAATGIATGYPDGSFHPATAVTRQAMAALLWRAAGQPVTGLDEPFFADVAADHPFYDAIQWMASTGLSTGTPDPGGAKPTFATAAPVSRHAMAAFLWRRAGEPEPTTTDPTLADVAPYHPSYDAIQWMAETGLSTGTPTAGGLPRYLPDDPVSRQATAAFLFRADGL